MERLVDVSQFQGDIDWRKVAGGGITGAFVRIADGNIRDPFYGRARVKALQEAGITWGPYYYGRVAAPGNGQRDGIKEARMAVGFAREAGWGEPDHLPLAYDFEEANKQPLAKAARHVIEFVREYRELAGHWAVLYTMPGFWNQVVGHLGAEQRRVMARCPLWIAHWEVSRPTVPSPWSRYEIWQHSDKGRVPGIHGPVDVDRSRGELKTLTIKAAAGRPDEPDVPVHPERPVLRRGDRGEAVRELQRLLVAMAAEAPKLDPGTPDGDFGERTERAVRAFQQRAGLAVDGVVGPATWEALSR